MRVRGRSKYGAIRTTVRGITFASKKEAARYQELLFLEKAGEIESLELQPAFPLRVILSTGTVQGALKAMAMDYPTIGRYLGDFKYFDLRTSKWIVEDVKGGKATMTPIWRWKVKHVRAQYGIEVMVV